MFSVIYEFKVQSGLEEQFERSWAEHTCEIREQLGGLGSRLHRNDDGSYVAYAQWPSREKWENAVALDTPARKAMRDALLSFETVYRLEVLNDLLEPIH